MKIKSIIFVLMLISTSMLCRAQSMDVYWAPGLTLSCAQIVSKSPNVISTGRLAPQFQIGNVGLRFSPFKNPGHSLDVDFLIWHTVVSQVNYKALFADQLVEGGGSTTMIYNGFSLGYSYNVQLSPRWRFYPMVKLNFLFSNGSLAGGTSSSPPFVLTSELSGQSYDVRYFDNTMDMAPYAIVDPTVSIGGRFTYHTKKRFFLLFGVQYYRGFRDQVFANQRMEDINTGEQLVYVNTKSKNSNLTIEFGFGGRIPLPKRKDKK